MRDREIERNRERKRQRVPQTDRQTTNFGNHIVSQIHLKDF